MDTVPPNLGMIVAYYYIDYATIMLVSFLFRILNISRHGLKMSRSAGETFRAPNSFSLKSLWSLKETFSDNKTCCLELFDPHRMKISTLPPLCFMFYHSVFVICCTKHGKIYITNIGGANHFIIICCTKLGKIYHYITDIGGANHFKKVPSSKKSQPRWSLPLWTQSKVFRFLVWKASLCDLPDIFGRSEHYFSYKIHTY